MNKIDKLVGAVDDAIFSAFNNIRERRKGRNDRKEFEVDSNNYFVFGDKRHEVCKCLTKTPEWKHHEKYCPIWKNGRIEELERALIMFDCAFTAEDIHDLGKAHEETRKVLNNGLRRNQKTMPV